MTKIGGTDQVPDPPEPFGEGGRRLWESALRAFDFEDHERILLVEACRTKDLIDAAKAELDRDGPTVLDRFGQAKIHPAEGIVSRGAQRLRMLFRELGFTGGTVSRPADIL
ncbi:MAG TPA: hypothetical protein RMF84_18850 [Polyangiaceae bacterium LLY-WYZ-14_1]|nr:hypothetical protein [Polyangiaceae bacterium LLY-WYZ-14_1]